MNEHSLLKVNFIAFTSVRVMIIDEDFNETSVSFKHNCLHYFLILLVWQIIIIIVNKLQNNLPEYNFFEFAGLNDWTLALKLNVHYSVQYIINLNIGRLHIYNQSNLDRFLTKKSQYLFLKSSLLII